MIYNEDCQCEICGKRAVKAVTVIEKPFREGEEWVEFKYHETRYFCYQHDTTFTT